MMNSSMRRKRDLVARHVVERREREQSAPRFAATFPAVSALSFEMREQATSVASEAVYIRRIMVAVAPAVFEVPCGDPTCEDGGHDITTATFRALGERIEHFSGESACRGATRGASCARVLRFAATASYKPL